MNNSKLVSWIHRLIKIELVLVIVVVIAGSVVRMTGSGMGCPDWPKCFGYMIPPTENWQVEWRPNTEFKKGQMIVHSQALWTAERDFVTGEQYTPENWKKYTKHNYAKFNVWHTWTEYLNRLSGALSGVPMLILFVLSLFVVRSNPLIFIGSAVSLFLLGFEAWLGKVVVDGNLVPNQITIHMLGAFLLIFTLSVMRNFTESGRIKRLTSTEQWLIPVLTVLFLSQVLMGTQVREGVDALVKQFGDDASREGWMDLLGVGVLIHRSASLAILGLAIYWNVHARKHGGLLGSSNGVMIMVILEALVGALLYYLEMPKLLQPTHLLLSAIIFGNLVYAWAVDWKFKLQLRGAKA